MTNPRRWFQIHLSTAIVMMIVLLWIFRANRAGDWDGWPEKLWDSHARYSDGKWSGYNAWEPMGITVNIVVGLSILISSGDFAAFIKRLRPVDRCKKALRIHLSTAILLLFFTGGFMGLNLTERDERGIGLGYTYGWPRRAVWYGWDYSGPVGDGISLVHTATRTYWINRMRVYLNIGVFVSLLLTLAGCSEYLIRRRAKT
jgi:hypothetical protein